MNFYKYKIDTWKNLFPDKLIMLDNQVLLRDRAFYLLIAVKW